MVAGQKSGCNRASSVIRRGWKLSKKWRLQQKYGGSGHCPCLFLRKKTGHALGRLVSLHHEFAGEFYVIVSSPNCTQQCQDSNDRWCTKKLPKETLEALERAEAMTHLNTGLILNFALQLWRDVEITQARSRSPKKSLDAKFSPEDITEEMIADSSLYWRVCHVS